MSEEIKIKIKQTSSNITDEILINEDATVAELKSKIEEKTGFKPEVQNLVYKGRILANDKTLNSYGLKSDHVVILVKKYVEEKKPEVSSNTTNSTSTINPSPSVANTSSSNLNQDPFSMYGGLGGDIGGGLGGLGGFGGLGGSGGLGGNMDINQISSLMSNPMYQQAMDSLLSNPQMLQQMLNNPQIKPLLDQNPQLRAMMSNPEFLRTMMNPQTLQGMTSMMGGQNTGGLGGNPFLQGFQPPTNTQPTSTQPNTQSQGTTSSNPVPNNFDFSSISKNQLI